MKSILFFALRDDLLSVLDDAEGVTPLKYVRVGRLPSPQYECMSHDALIPLLGEASADSAVNSATFLVSARDTPLAVRAIPADLGPAYAMDQLLNPDTVTFAPGGLRGQGILLHGRIATVSVSPAAQRIMKLFHSAIRNRFGKLKAFYVGPSAHRMLEAGGRLTISTQSPPDFDLTLS